MRKLNLDQYKARILIVDDNKDNLIMLNTILSKTGYHIQTALDGKSAIEKILEIRFDLMLLDVMMPEMDGFSVLEVVREKFSMMELPIIMLTAVSDNPHIIKALSLGANDYVTKPYDFSVIRSRISTQISLKKTQEALKKSEERYALAAQATMDGLWDWEIEKNVIYYSPNWKKIIGYGEDELENTPEIWLDRLHPADRGTMTLAFEKMLSGKITRFEEEQRIIHRDGSYRWVITTGIAVPDETGEIIRLTGSMSDITDRRIYNAVTGLPNQVLLLDQIERLLRQFKNNPNQQAALIFIDLDRFKLINQALGIVVGDAVLAEIASRLNETIGPEDILAHFGRDEFLLLVPDFHHLKYITSLVMKIRKNIAAPISLPQLTEEIIVTSSIGVVIVDEKYESVQRTLQDAESAMQRAKSAGNNNFRFFCEDMYREVKERMNIETLLRKAIERDELILFYQPLVNVYNGRMFGVEVLVHWKNPENGLVPPGQLIPLAEDNGMIIPIGEWILEKACTQFKEWTSDGLDIQRLAVNLSPLQFNQEDLVKTLKRTLEKTGVDPRRLELEITESHAMTDPETSIRIMERLKELGVSLSIDDFGTGYSSLSMLKRFPLSTLKIDRSFIMDVPGDDDAVAIVRAIVAMAQSLKFDIIAEGVEDISQLEFLKNLGCEKYQGFLFSRSVPASQIPDMIIKSNREMARA
ncbi:MAG: EAL domain-containing protein [Spirochaetales bacterium]|nr:EAL domain-containing protein [Spirochaetales bacterium]